MPSWRDGSSGDSYSFLDHVQSDSSDSLGCGRQVEDGWPDWIRDPDYNGEETSVETRCFCELPVARYVAFHGTNLGRKFLGCQHEDEKRCTYVHWVDPVWCPQLKRSIRKLWWMLQDKDLEKETAIWDGKAKLADLKCSMEEEKMKMEVEEAERLVALQARNGILMEKMKAELENYRRLLAVAVSVAGCLGAVVCGFMFKHAKSA